jgi:soluble lytic murein transglycosylase-like protein
VPQVATTRCSVDILTPSGTRVSFDVQGGQSPGRSVEGGLIAVDTHKDLAQAVGGFRLILDGSRDWEGRAWAERIPRRSLVFITMDRDGPLSGPGDTTTVMVGFTDRHQVQESYAEAGPRRRTQIHGREVSCVLLDAMLVFHPLLAANPAYGTLTVTSAAWDKLPLALTTNPLLVTPGEPQGILRLILETLLFAGGDPVFGTQASGTSPALTPTPQHPLITLDLPGLSLRDVLDPNYAVWNTFEPVRVALAQFPTLAGSLWNYLHLFIDRTFQEFFTRIEGSQSRIHFRGKPFQHARVRSGTRFKPTTEEPTLQTLALDPADIVSQERATDTANVYNFFSVEPRGMTDLLAGNFFRYNVFPQVVTDAAHPSFVGRYGLRPMQIHSPYMDPLPPPGTGEASGAPAPLKPAPAGSATYAPLAAQIAAEQGLPPALRPWFVANIHVESSFNPTAVNPKGAQGLGQLLPSTAALVGVTDPFDPVQSLTGAARYWNILRAFSHIGDNPQLIVAAYNAGPQAVKNAGGIPPIPETERHVRLVTAAVPQYAGVAGIPARQPVPPPVAAQAPGVQDDIIQRAQRWAAILAGWYDMGGELFSATVTVRGHPAWNIGHRLFSHDEQGDWEAYIEGVQHHYDHRTGQYLTTLRLTRGWYLSPSHGERLREEGRTTVTEATGGPPVIDPGGRGTVTIGTGVARGEGGTTIVLPDEP